MPSYYTVLIILSWMSLGVLCILVHENSWIPRTDKRQFYLTYGIIALSALAEWCGLQLSGNERFPGWLLPLVKCADYALTPLAGGAIVGQMKLRDRWSKALVVVLIANAVFQIIASFNSWMIVIDDHNNYMHGPLYPIYIAGYLAVIGLAIVEFLVYGKAFPKQNRASLYGVMILVIAGVGAQELLGGEYRTAYIALTMGVALMFIHYSEFYQMTADAHIMRQHNQIMKDELSGAFSRHAYAKALKDFDEMARLPEDFATFTIDINGLKMVNDTMGHDAGDELIIGAARCIEKVMGSAGQCYRTGGDEFVVLARMSREQAEAALVNLERETGLWTGEEIRELGLSAGYALACDHEGLTAENLVKEADRAMYVAKAAYYQKSGYDRRAVH